jgi:hypothetical protein
MSGDRFDVLERFAPLFEAPERSFERFLRRRDRKRRNQRIAAGVVGVAVFAAAVWTVTTGGPFDRTEVGTGPTDPPPVGLVGLPPEGATPSTPATGELVLSYFGPSLQTWVYADGRLIRQRQGDLPGTTTGLVEQRLTPDGVELLRSEVVSTGLFDHDVDLASSGDISWGSIQARAGDRLVGVSWSEPYPGFSPRTVATPEQAIALERLVGLLTHPASWLPESAWEEPELGAYVPSTYSVCYRIPQPLAASRIFDLLPEQAAELLRAENRTRRSEGDPPSVTFCSSITTGKARALADILAETGVRWGPKELSYWVAAGPRPGDGIQIWFEPYLPHGEVSCSPCG